MIPDCGDDGYLPAGIHPATLMELVDLAAFQQFTERTFATDRNLVAKGMVGRQDTHFSVSTNNSHHAPGVWGVEKSARIEWIWRSRIAGFVAPIPKNFPPLRKVGQGGVATQASGIVSGSGVGWQQGRVASRDQLTKRPRAPCRWLGEDHPPPNPPFARGGKRAINPRGARAGYNPNFSTPHPQRVALFPSSGDTIPLRAKTTHQA